MKTRKRCISLLLSLSLIVSLCSQTALAAEAEMIPPSTIDSAAETEVIPSATEADAAPLSEEPEKAVPLANSSLIKENVEFVIDGITYTIDLYYDGTSRWALI